MGLRLHKLKKDPPLLVTFSNLSFSNNDDLETQLGYVILMGDETKRVNWLRFASYKCRRMVQSVLGGEIYTFADCFDAVFSVSNDISRLIGK